MEENPVREFHAVAELFPLLRGRAFEELAADIKKNGLREPILLDAEGADRRWAEPVSSVSRGGRGAALRGVGGRG